MEICQNFENFWLHFLNMTKLRLYPDQFYNQTPIFDQKVIFCQNLKHFRKFCGSKIHRAMPYLDCLFTTEGCGFKKLIKPNDLPLLDGQDQFSVRLTNFRSNLINFQPISSQFWSKMQFYRILSNEVTGEQRTYLFEFDRICSI